MINVKIEHLKAGTQTPKLSTTNAACFDCYLPTTYPPLEPGEIRIVPLGFKVDIPHGFKLMIYGRSGLASKGIIAHVGTVDSDYLGEVGVILTNISRAIQPLNEGDRICQCAVEAVIPISWEESNVIKETERSSSGFGSSGGHSSLNEGEPAS